MLLLHRHAATASWLKEKQHIPPTTVAESFERRDAEKKVPGKTKIHNQKNVIFKFYNTSFVLFSGAPVHVGAKQEKQA
jgi:hypothetical protein